MKKIIFAIIMLLTLGWQGAKAQKIVVNREVQSQKYGALLLGHQTADQFEKEPFSIWFQQEYSDYQPNVDIIKKLKKEKIGATKIMIFMGTWSEVSQREFPKLMKILEAVKYPKNKLEIIALNAKNESPIGVETAHNIQKIPTIILKKYGKELSRVAEMPKSGSWEQDILEIIDKR